MRSTSGIARPIGCLSPFVEPPSKPMEWLTRAAHNSARPCRRKKIKRELTPRFETLCLVFDASFHFLLLDEAACGIAFRAEKGGAVEHLLLELLQVEVDHRCDVEGNKLRND